jgi:hypothetical protein
MDGRFTLDGTGCNTEPTRKLGVERRHSSQSDELRNWGALCFGYFDLGKQIKVTRLQAKPVEIKFI